MATQTSKAAAARSASKGWELEIKHNGTTYMLTKANALRVVATVPTRLKGKDKRSYTLYPGRTGDSNSGKKAVIVLTSTELFPFYKTLRMRARPVIKYDGPKPNLKDSNVNYRFILPGISANQ